VNAIGQRIRELRRERGITRNELAKRARSSGPSISRIEKGTHEQSLDLVCRVAAALDVKPSAILGVLDEVTT
jgi:XRE family aerobic/anaerobic benzoate catabolism transcriptional regulator